MKQQHDQGGSLNPYDQRHLSGATYQRVTKEATDLSEGLLSKESALKVSYVDVPEKGFKGQRSIKKVPGDSVYEIYFCARPFTWGSVYGKIDW